jgi:hypothetical protein
MKLGLKPSNKALFFRAKEPKQGEVLRKRAHPKGDALAIGGRPKTMEHVFSAIVVLAGSIR